jgi:hypothetical protein
MNMYVSGVFKPLQQITSATMIRQYLDCDDLIFAEAVTNLWKRQRAHRAQLQAANHTQQ